MSGGACGPSSVAAMSRPKTAFVVTVDVESRSHGGPEADILGVLDGYRERFGIERIMDLLEGQQARGTFFVNAYEAARHGEEAMARITRLIHARGHDVGLHTHPRSMYPFYGMSQAPLDAQIEMLNTGMALLRRWTGKLPTAHRAGAFSANRDTLRAAEAVRLSVDSSLSPGSRVVVPLVDELGATNVARRVGKVLEIPVTYFDQVRIGPWRSRRILDVEGCSLSEIKHVVRWATRNRVPTICILMHSFSFSRFGVPNRRVMQRFAAMLAWLRTQESITIGTIEQAAALVPEHPAAVSVGDAHTGLWLTWRRALEAWSNGWKNRVVVVAGLAGMAAVVAALVWLARVLTGY